MISKCLLAKTPSSQKTEPIDKELKGTKREYFNNRTNLEEKAKV
jgi:hypothetical protein